MSDPLDLASDPHWLSHCETAALDPHRRLQARQQLLQSAEALEATLYRPDHEDADAEEEELGEARLLLDGQFQPPADWDAATCAEYYDGEDPATFFSARVECCAQPGSRDFFHPEPGDLLAVTASDGHIQMYYLYEALEDDAGWQCVLIREDEPL